MTDISSVELATALGIRIPTVEQQKIIESALEPSLVIAGAGSGKTETMANRVVWLVANKKVQVHEILGMTFTRKAAGELGERIRERLEQLVNSGVVDLDINDLDQVTVTTYNSFANRIYSQYAVLIGRDPDAIVLGEAASWQLARDVAKAATGDALSDLDKNLDAFTDAILTVSRALADNVANPDEVIKYAQQLGEHLAPMPIDPDSKTKKKPFDSWVRATEVAHTLPILVDLAQKYEAIKAQRGLIEFSDQVALALEICQKFVAVVEDFQSQFKVVLLDEYQDTSVVQTRLLSLLFARTPVMAVGDPHQSIYAWRGASADNIESFGESFGESISQTPTYSLSTSWRNPDQVLAAANVLVSPLTTKTRVPVTTLQSREGSGPGELDCIFSQTIIDEATSLAGWIKDRLRAETTAAMLCRSLKNIEPFKKAFDEAGIRYHVIGLGGLLDEPVIIDLVCMLRVLHDASADSELIRLLSGARWRIGTKDLAGLNAVARWMTDRDHRQQKLSDTVKNALKNSVVAEDGASLVDALDFVAVAPEGHKALSEISSEGLKRLVSAGKQIARLRRHVGVDLRELVTIVEQELLLDIETVANESAATAMASLEAFMEPISAYVEGEDRATLGGFLGWLKEAERRERLSPQSAPAEKGTVQIMTIHGSKGLEWDLVAIPRMVKDELPGNRTTQAQTWLGFGRLPFAFRGDAAHLPIWNWRNTSTQKELEESFLSFREEVRIQFDDEQRRLAYVALTRARQGLLLTGSYWSKQKGFREPSVFLYELAESGVITTPLPSQPELSENPLGDAQETVTWPLDPLGNRRDIVWRAAELVLTANPRDPTDWDDEIELLLAEKKNLASSDIVLELPERIPASKFKDYIADPIAVARALRRPLPERPYRATSLGTLFHSWVELRSKREWGGDLLDSQVFERDDLDVVGDLSDAELEKLKKTFQASKWGELKPVDVEIEINVPLGSTTVVCKIDAVYEYSDAQGKRFEIVDWKTGKSPSSAADLDLKQFQLALYRMAYSRYTGIPAESIDAVFYFVQDDLIIRPERIYSESELEERWSSATGSIPR